MGPIKGSVGLLGSPVLLGLGDGGCDSRWLPAGFCSATGDPRGCSAHRCCWGSAMAAAIRGGCPRGCSATGDPRGCWAHRRVAGARRWRLRFEVVARGVARLPAIRGVARLTGVAGAQRWRLRFEVVARGVAQQWLPANGGCDSRWLPAGLLGYRGRWRCGSKSCRRDAVGRPTAGPAGLPAELGSGRPTRWSLRHHGAAPEPPRRADDLVQSNAMFRIIDRYIVRETLSPTLLSLLVFTFLLQIPRSCGTPRT